MSPLWFVAVPVCRRFSLSPFWLSPFRFVAWIQFNFTCATVLSLLRRLWNIDAAVLHWTCLRHHWQFYATVKLATLPVVVAPVVVCSIHRIWHTVCSFEHIFQSPLRWLSLFVGSGRMIGPNHLNAIFYIIVGSWQTKNIETWKNKIDGCILFIDGIINVDINMCILWKLVIKLLIEVHYVYL